MTYDVRGLRLLLTRSAADNRRWAAALEAGGAEAVSLPCIATESLPLAAEQITQELESCDVIALTSPRAVHALAACLDAKAASLHEGKRLAAVGPATAAAVQARWGRVDFVAPAGTAGDLGALLAAHAPKIQQVLCAGAREGRTDLVDALQAAGVACRHVATYATLPATTRGPRMALVHARLDAALLASPSALTGLLALARIPEKVPLVTIGPTTSEAVRDAGLRVAAESTTRDLTGMVEALQCLRLGKGANA